MAEVELKLAAILSADVVGYSRLIAEDEDATVHTLTLYREQIDVLVRGHSGRVVDFTGDNFLAEFPSAREAIVCAIEIQRVLKARNAVLPPDQQMKFRIGAHLGDIRVEEGRFYGDGVNIAARLEKIAEPGGICISATMHEQVRNRLEVEFVDLGDQLVKNIPDRVHVFQVVFEPERVEPALAFPRGRRTVAFAVLAVAGLIAGVAGWRLLFPEPATSPAASLAAIRSLAVLPLQDLSEGGGQEYFADGLTEELTSTLARIAALRVISRTSAMQYKGATSSLPEIARELNVDGMIEGSVLRVGDRVRISVQLIHARSDEHVWAQSYTRDLTDILALQSDVARAVADAVKLKLTAQEQRQLASAQVVNVDAHEAYLKGRYFLGKGTADGDRRAIEYFEQALREDPEFALAYAGLADAYSCDLCWSLREDVMAKSKAAARRALELDESLAEAHTALGVIKAMHEWDFAGGEVEFQRAMRLNPGYVRAHAGYAHVLAGMGRLDEAIAEMELARELDPLSVSAAVDLGVLYARRGEYVQAVDQLERALELDPDSPAAHRALGRLDCDRGSFDSAFSALQRARQLSNDDPMILGDLGYCYAKSGREGEARGVLRELEEQDRGSVTPMSPALIHVSLNEHDQAFEWLERAYEARVTLLPTVLMDPRYERLRTDPRFAELLRRMGGRKAASP